MKTYQTEALLTLVANVARNGGKPLHDITIGCSKLQKLASSLRKRYEAACSYEWACTTEYERRTDKLELKAQTLAKDLGVFLEIQRDPRGWPFIVTTGKTEISIG